jgi:hypothetical protein
VTTAFVSRPPPCTRGNEVCNVFSRKLDSGDDGESPRGAGSRAPLARGEGPQLSTESVGSMLRRRRSYRKKWSSAEAVFIRGILVIPHRLRPVPINSEQYSVTVHTF